MAQYNISQYHLMEFEDQSQREKRGGLSTVCLWPSEGSQRAFRHGWVGILSRAMQEFFDCKSYSQKSKRKEEITWAFYGIAEHTVLAAIAFEATHNLIQDWAVTFDSISARNSYCIGIAEGLRILAEEEKAATEKGLPSEIGEGLTSDKEKTSWNSMRQLSAYRQISKDIEESVLKAHNIKPRNAKKVKRFIRDRNAYMRGGVDNKKINVRAARFERGKN